MPPRVSVSERMDHDAKKSTFSFTVQAHRDHVKIQVRKRSSDFLSASVGDFTVISWLLLFGVKLDDAGACSPSRRQMYSFPFLLRVHLVSLSATLSDS